VIAAYPDDLFSIATILFGTPEFFYKDNVRLREEHSAKGLYSIMRGVNYRYKHFEDERIATCDEPHRKLCLEHLAIQYQFFRNDGISEDEGASRIDAIYSIIDRLNLELEGKIEDEEDRRKLEHLTARMDRRKMNPKVSESEDGKTLIEFNPQFTEEIKADRDRAENDFQDKFKYGPLALWGHYKFDSRHDRDSYDYYDSDINRVVRETKEVMQLLQSNDDEDFYIRNYSTPAFTCAAIVRLFQDKVSKEDLQFCKNVVISTASWPLSANYNYQISDGVEAAINALPYLFPSFPDDCERMSGIMLFILFDRTSIGNYKKVGEYAGEAISRSMWKKSPIYAKSILLAFLELKGTHDEKLKEIRKNSGFISREDRFKVLDEIANERNDKVDRIFSGDVDITLADVPELSLETFEIALGLIPRDISDKLLIDIVERTLPQIASLLSPESIDDRSNPAGKYQLRISIFNRFAYFLLSRPQGEVERFIKPFENAFAVTEETSEFLDSIVSAEDQINSYEPFWIVWERLYHSFKTMVEVKGGNRHLGKVVHSYLLAWPWWKESAKDWRSLKDRQRLFFARVSSQFEDCPVLLSAMAQFLNQIGANFLNDGISWVGNIIQNIHTFEKRDISSNTIYYLELLVRRYAYLNRTVLRTTPRERANFITILNFLVKNGSTKGYLLREYYA
jgi:hypothetical protein